MNTSPPIIGLTLNYRDSERTLRCVYSLLREGVDHVLIFDNSEDNGVSLRSLSKTLAGETRVSFKISPNNLGFAAGVNKGVEWITSHFSTPWVLLLNNDACLLPGAIPPLVQALVEHTEAVISYPNINHAGQILGTTYYQRYTGLLSSRPLPDSFPFASGCCQLIATDRSGDVIFDEDFFMYGEDCIQGWKLGRAGMAHVEKTLVFHEGSASSEQGSEFYETQTIKAHINIAKIITRGKLDSIIMLSFRGLILGMRAIKRAARNRNMTPIICYIREFIL